MNILKTITFKKKEIILFSIFLLACYLVFFYRLETPSLRMWDESRRAINALEMTLNNNWLVTHYDGQPDMTGTKPPILIWLIALSMKIFGYNEFAVRLPSAISATATAIIVFVFAYKYFDDIRISILSGFVLITSIGFAGEHVARTGDFDALLILWVTVYSLSFFKCIQSDDDIDTKYLTIGTAALILAALTKSVAGFLALPGIFMYSAIYKKNFYKLISSRKIHIAIIVCIAFVSAFYLLREFFNPGYLEAVINNEVTGRYLNALENHKGSIFFYLRWFIYKFFPWICILPFVLLLIKNTRKKIKDFVYFGIFYIVFYVLIISFSQTKLPWYDAQVYPMASLLIGITLYGFLEKIFTYFNFKVWFSDNLVSSFIVLGFLLPIYIIFFNYHIIENKGMIYHWSKQSVAQLWYGDYLREINSAFPELKSFFIVSDDSYNAHLLFYKKVANLNSYNLNIVSSSKKFNAKEVIISCDKKIIEALKKTYKTNDLHNYQDCHTLQIKNN